MKNNVVLHPGATHLRPTSTITGDHKGGRTAPTGHQPGKVSQRRALTGLCAIGQAISREFRDLGTSIRARAARIAASRTGVDAFVEAFSVIPHNSRQSAAPTADTKKTRAHVGFDKMSALKTQNEIAAAMLLPTSFASVRDNKAAAGQNLTQSELEPVLSIEEFRKLSPAVLDKFLEFSLKEKSAENLFFLIAAEQLQSSEGVKKQLCAVRMQHGFTNPNALLEPNFSGNTKASVQSLINDLAANRDRPDLEQVIEQATRNLLQSCGADAYKRWRQTLPA